MESDPPTFKTLDPGSNGTAEKGPVTAQMNRDRKMGRIQGIEMTGNLKREESGQQGREVREQSPA